MTMFDRRLIDYLPPVIKDVREYQAILNDGEQREFADLWDAAGYALDDQFVHSSTEYGVMRWERILEIIPGAGETLDERKLRVLVRLNENLPYTIRFLRQRLTDMFGEGKAYVAVDHNNYLIKIGVEARNLYWEQELMRFIEAIKPANLGYAMSIRYVVGFEGEMMMLSRGKSAVKADIDCSGQLTD